jgi:hypothetical protein
MVRDNSVHTKFDTVRRPTNFLYSSAKTTITLKPGGELEHACYKRD